MITTASGLLGINEPTYSAITIAGAFVFGVSGGLAAVRARLDIFGVMVLAATVGLAGGILRNVLLGLNVLSLLDWRFVLAVVLAGVTAFCFRVRLTRWRASIDAFDAVGLSLFCVIGTDVALHHGAGPVPAALLGTITAVGGGAVRDVVLRKVPEVLRQGLYAVPALLGASFVALGWELHHRGLAWNILGALLCLAVRVVGMVYKINLPIAPVPGSDEVEA